MASTISVQDALVYIMVTTSAVDTAMNDKELARIGRLTRFLPVFDGFDEERLIPVSRDCAAILSEDEGLSTMLALVRDAIPPRLHDTAYALAVEVASADMHIQAEEIRFLQMLRDRLDLDKLTCAGIERNVIARFRTL
ncbi:tellurite resistance TerB family protein [Pararhizobium mangrovi]|uniref:Tellurite resistance protein TerB n=1 Tax=Pararhizobium mangrovi TaxID=2590452 RepID=A0A506U3R7_9HYPH|nr:tellurite resistance TerB family protein [Pararhizobium mangrovi]TPW27976.1 Tellurite resistance protein TerB [Pararhizobium mangrovi]